MPVKPSEIKEAIIIAIKNGHAAPATPTQPNRPTQVGIPQGKLYLFDSSLPIPNQTKQVVDFINTLPKIREIELLFSNKEAIMGTTAVSYKDKYFWMHDAVGEVFSAILLDELRKNPNIMIDLRNEIETILPHWVVGILISFKDYLDNPDNIPINEKIIDKTIIVEYRLASEAAIACGIVRIEIIKMIPIVFMFIIITEDIRIIIK